MKAVQTCSPATDTPSAPATPPGRTCSVQSKKDISAYISGFSDFDTLEKMKNAEAEMKTKIFLEAKNFDDQ